MANKKKTYNQFIQFIGRSIDWGVLVFQIFGNSFFHFEEFFKRFEKFFKQTWLNAS